MDLPFTIFAIIMFLIFAIYTGWKFFQLKDDCDEFDEFKNE